EVRRPVLITESVTADDNWLGPARNQPWDVGDHNRLAENGAAQYVSDRSVGRQPHLLEVEFLDAGLVGGDGRALDAHTVLLDGIGGVDRHLVIGAVAVLDAQVVILEVDVEMRQDQHVLDELPDDAGHLVTVELYYRTFDLDLAFVGHLRPNPPGVGSKAERLLVRPAYKEPSPALKER